MSERVGAVNAPGEETGDVHSADSHRLTLCLEFANTVDWHAGAQPVEKIVSYEDLLAWAKKHGLVDEERARHLSGEAARRPADAQAVRDTAVAVRESIYRLLSAVARGTPLPESDLAVLNRALGEAMAHAQITHREGRLAWGWRAAPGDLDQVLRPVVRSAADLLVSDALARVKECADDRGCGWLFLDRSKNRSRRWCSMDSCGNRAKAQQHYRRRKTRA